MYFHFLKASIFETLYFLKFIYTEKATKFCEIFILLLTTVHTVKSKGKISQNFVAFSEYMNFTVNNTNISFFKKHQGYEMFACYI